MPLVCPVCDDVRYRGAQVVREYTVRFDGVVDLATTLVPQAALDEALAALTPSVKNALEEAARRTRQVHQAQLPAEKHHQGDRKASPSPPASSRSSGPGST